MSPHPSHGGRVPAYTASTAPTRAIPVRDERPLLLFFTSRRSGVARRMASLVAWVSVTEKARLRVVEVDVDANEPFARALAVTSVPTLLVVHGRAVLARH